MFASYNQSEKILKLDLKGVVFSILTKFLFTFIF
jgi:hypothetical protein